MAQFSQRPFQPDDAPFIIAAHLFPHAAGYVSAPPTEEMVLKSIGAPGDGRRIILDERGERAGLWTASLHEGWLVELRLIIAAVPRSGAGRFGIQSAVAWAFREMRAHRIWLEVTAGNLAARSLYESEGFTHEGTYRDGFRHADGTFEDLAHYGLLENEVR